MACGLCYGIVLSLFTNITKSLNMAFVLLGISAWGVAGGIIAVFSAYIFSFAFINDLLSAIFRKGKISR